MFVSPDAKTVLFFPGSTRQTRAVPGLNGTPVSSPT